MTTREINTKLNSLAFLSAFSSYSQTEKDYQKRKLFVVNYLNQKML